MILLEIVVIMYETIQKLTNETINKKILYNIEMLEYAI